MDADVAGGGVEWAAAEFDGFVLLGVAGRSDAASGEEFFAVAGEGELNFGGELNAESLVEQETGADFLDAGLFA